MKVALLIAALASPSLPLPSSSPVPGSVLSQDDEKPDKRPEIKQMVTDLKGHIKKRGAEDLEAIEPVFDPNAFQQAHQDNKHEHFMLPEDENHDMMNYRRGDQWRLRGMCSTPLVLDLFPRRCLPWFEQLLGEGEGTRPGIWWPGFLETGSLGPPARGLASLPHPASPR